MDENIPNQNTPQNKTAKVIIISGNLYSKEEIIEAAYLMLDRAYVEIRGEIGKEVTITLSPKKTYETVPLKKIFEEELVKAAYNQKHDLTNAEIQKTIMTKLLFSDTIPSDTTSTKENLNTPLPTEVKLPTEVLNFLEDSSNANDTTLTNKSIKNNESKD